MQNLANCNCRPDIMQMIQQIMDTVSPHAAAYKHMYQVEQEQIRRFGVHAKTVKMIFKCGHDQTMMKKAAVHRDMMKWLQCLLEMMVHHLLSEISLYILEMNHAKLYPTCLQIAIQ